MKRVLIGFLLIIFSFSICPAIGLEIDKGYVILKRHNQAWAGYPPPKNGTWITGVSEMHISGESDVPIVIVISVNEAIGYYIGNYFYMQIFGYDKDGNEIQTAQFELEQDETYITTLRFASLRDNLDETIKVWNTLSCHILIKHEYRGGQASGTPPAPWTRVRDFIAGLVESKVRAPLWTMFSTWTLSADGCIAVMLIAVVGYMLVSIGRWIVRRNRKFVRKFRVKRIETF